MKRGLPNDLALANRSHKKEASRVLRREALFRRFSRPFQATFSAGNQWRSLCTDG